MPLLWSLRKSSVVLAAGTASAKTPKQWHSCLKEIRVTEKIVVASRLHRCWQLLRYLGPKWLMYRAYHAARMESGLIRRQLPMKLWDEQPLSSFLKNSALSGFDRYAAHRKREAPRFFFDPKTILEIRPQFAQWDSQDSSPLIYADDLRAGFVRFFSHERVDVGYPPRWHQDPFTGNSFPVDRHWSQIGDFSAGDIKLAWETNRFGFVFPLVRSYWRTGDETYAEIFWRLVQSWRAVNPPQAGINWKCGQEISLRVMAWVFGMYGFGTSSSSTPSRVAMLANMIAVSGRRIEANIGYAISQKNNHGLSEAMGLWTIGTLFPEFTNSQRWAATGRSLLESQASELIYDDGAFSQHSMNYHRVMLHDYLWSMRLGDVVEQPFSAKLRDRIARAGEFVYQLQDESTGRVPCYGQDDGALILPLSNCDYRDYRPIVQAIHFLTTGQRRLETGPWDEDLLWLFGKSSLATSREDLVENRLARVPHYLNDRARLYASTRKQHPYSEPDVVAHDPAVPDASPTGASARPERPGHPLTSKIAHGHSTLVPQDFTRVSQEPGERKDGKGRHDFDAPVGGYATLRSPHGFAMTRASSFRHRPAQADMLHVDIWWRGQNIAIDPGTYSYNASPPWNNRLAHTPYHNTVTVDGIDQMDRASRFLWLPWLSGESFGRNVRHRGDVSCWNGEHDGYRRLPDPVTHRRGVVRLGADHWLVVDSLTGCQPHSFRLHWLLLDVPYESDIVEKTLELQTDAGDYSVAAAASISDLEFAIARASTDSADGWRSSYYHSREPAISVCLEATATQIVFATALGPDVRPPTIDGHVVLVGGSDWNAAVSLDLISSQATPLVTSIDAEGSLVSAISPIGHHTTRPVLESPSCTFC